MAKNKARLIIEFREQGQPLRSVATTRHMAMGPACDVFGITAERGIAWADVKDEPEDKVYLLFYPDGHARESVFDGFDCDYIHREITKVGVNLRPLHDGQKAGCARQALHDRYNAGAGAQSQAEGVSQGYRHGRRHLGDSAAAKPSLHGLR